MIGEVDFAFIVVYWVLSRSSSACDTEYLSEWFCCGLGSGLCEEDDDDASIRGRLLFALWFCMLKVISLVDAAPAA